MIEKEDKRRCSICDIPFERNNYFYGKLMTVRDFKDEQCYFNEKRWLINRMVLGWGVVCGLDVYEKDGKVCIAPGLAIDCCGREILVCKDEEVPLKPELSECHKKEQVQQNCTEYAVCLKFKECRTESVHIPPSACDQKERCEFNRIKDGYEINLIKLIQLPKQDKPFCPKIDDCPEYLFSWNEIPGKGSENLIEFLKQNFCIDWVKPENIKKSNHDKTIEITTEKNYLSIELSNEKTKAILTIDNNRTYEFIVKTEYDKLNVYKKDKEKSLHHYICDRLVKCPECHDPLCIILAIVTLDNDLKIQGKIDTCTYRKLVYNNHLLYDLINCYHGDLPRVCDVSWKDEKGKIIHNRTIEWADFETLVKSGLKVTFNKLIDWDTININTFLVAAIIVDEATGYRLLRYIPSDDIIKNNINGVTEANFIFESGWKSDEVEGKHSAIAARGAEFEIILRGNSIYSKEGKALDGSFMGILPSGSGTQGSDFVSYFAVEGRK